MRPPPGDESSVEISPGKYRVSALVEIEEFNEFFGTGFSDEEVETIGGLVISEIGKLPKRGERIVLDDLNVTVSRADNRRIQTLYVQKREPDSHRSKRKNRHRRTDCRDDRTESNARSDKGGEAVDKKGTKDAPEGD